MTSPAGGTDRDPEAERLRRTMAGVAARREPGPAPVRDILRAGRARRVRRRRVTVAAAACLVVCLAVPVARLSATRSGRAVVPPAVTASPVPGPPVVSATASPSPPAGRLSVPIGAGRVDGLPWSVTFEYYAKAPQGYGDPAHRPVLCERMYVGGVRLDRRGGTWADCGIVRPADGDAGPAQVYSAGGPGQAGYLIVVGNPAPGATHAVVTLRGGRQLTVQVVAVPGTVERAFAVALGPGDAVGHIDEYDATNTEVRAYSPTTT